MKIGKPMNRDKTLGLLLAAACFAGGLWEATAQEWLRIHYISENRNSGSRAVNPGDTREFVEASYYSVNLPAGLRYMQWLNVRDKQRFQPDNP